METDYSTIKQSDFERELKRYVAFRILNGEPIPTDLSDGNLIDEKAE
jgi:hypothetical protein